MTYEKLIDTVREIVANEEIYKIGLSLSYELDEKLHRKVNEDLFYKFNDASKPLIWTDTFEVEIDGIVIRFIKK